MAYDDLPSTGDSYMLERLIVPVVRYRWIIVGAAVLGLIAAGFALFARTQVVAPEPSASAQLLMPHGPFRTVASHDIDADLAILRSGAVQEIAEDAFGSPLTIVADRVAGMNVLALAVTTSDEEGASAGAQAVLDAFIAVRHDVLSDVLESLRDDVVNRLESLPTGDGGGSIAPGGSNTPTLVPEADVSGDGLELSYRRAVLGERLDEIEVALSSLEGTEPIAITSPADEDSEEPGELPVVPVLALGTLGGIAAGLLVAWSIPYVVAARRILRQIDQERS